MPVIIGVNFDPVHGSGPDHFWGMVGFGVPAHPTNFWQGEEITNRCFCHISWRVDHCIPFQPIKRQTCFPGRWVDSLCMLFTFAYFWGVLHKLSQKSAMTSCSLLASSTNLHSLPTGYWSPAALPYCLLTGSGIISATRFIVASFVCNDNRMQNANTLT